MKIQQILNEMPIKNFSRIGNFNKNSSFGTIDRKILTNDKAITKIKNLFKNTNFDFNMVFVNNPEGKKQAEVGVVTRAWLSQMMPDTYIDFEPLYDPNAINILFTNNTGEEKVQLSAWILAHRFGHALNASRFRNNDSTYYMKENEKLVENYLNRILENVYGLKTKSRSIFDRTETQFKKILNSISTFKSARDNNVRSNYEYIYEFLAQFLIIGQIKFNPLPKKLLYRYSYGKPLYKNISVNDNDYEYYDNSLIDLAEQLQDNFNALLVTMNGKILVM